MYTSKGWITFGAHFLLDEFNAFIKDENGNKIPTVLFPVTTHTLTLTDPYPLQNFRTSSGRIRTTPIFLKDEFGVIIPDEFGNGIVIYPMPGTIWSTEHYLISNGVIEFWGSGRANKRFILETAN